MYSALIKGQLTRPSAVRVSRLAQASIHEKSQGNVKGHEECMLKAAQGARYKANA